MEVAALLLISAVLGGPGLTVVRGTVTDADRRPVARADVWVMDLTERHAQTTSSESHGTTDAEGRYAVKLPEEAPYGLANHLHVVACDAQAGVAHLRLDARDLPIGPHDLVLVPTGPVKLKVVDPAGKPVSDCQVQLNELSDPQDITYPVPRSSPAVFTATTNRLGEVAFNMPRGPTYFDVIVTAPGFGRQMMMVNRNPAREYVLPLVAAGRVRGRLTGTDSEPLSGASVALNSTCRTARTAPQIHVMGFADVTTDAEGRFEVSSLAAGLVRIAGVTSPAGSAIFLKESPPKSKDFPSSDFEAGELRAGETLEVDVPTVPGVLVSGTILDDETLKPIAGIRVHLTAHGGRGQSVRSARTDEKGKYTFAVAADSLTATVQVGPLTGNYLPATSDSQGGRRVVTGQLPEVPDFRLKRGVMLSGVVVDEQQRPAAHVEVQAGVADLRNRHYHRAVVESDEHGKFTIGPVDADLFVALIAADRTRSCLKPLVVEPRTWKESGEITITIDPAAMITLSGRVVSLEGKPIADAFVSSGRDLRGGAWACEGITELLPVRSQTTKSDADGKYTLPGRFPVWGIYFVEARHGRLSARRSIVPPTDVQPGTPYTLEDLIVKPEADSN